MSRGSEGVSLSCRVGLSSVATVSFSALAIMVAQTQNSRFCLRSKRASERGIGDGMTSAGVSRDLRNTQVLARD